MSDLYRTVELSSQITKLRDELNDLIANYIPQYYEDGAVRYLAPDIYKKIKTLGDKLHILECEFFNKPIIRNPLIQYRTQFGVITLKEVNSND